MENPATWGPLEHAVAKALTPEQSEQAKKTKTRSGALNSVELATHVLDCVFADHELSAAYKQPMRLKLAEEIERYRNDSARGAIGASLESHIADVIRAASTAG